MLVEVKNKALCENVWELPLNTEGLDSVLSCRDAIEELRIKKTVDAWINTLSKEIQVKLKLCHIQ